jgi:hypothetical protein
VVRLPWLLTVTSPPLPPPAPLPPNENQPELDPPLPRRSYDQQRNED